MKGSHFEKGEGRKNVMPLFQHADQSRDACWPELLRFNHFSSPLQKWRRRHGRHVTVDSDLI